MELLLLVIALLCLRLVFLLQSVHEYLDELVEVVEELGDFDEGVVIGEGLDPEEDPDS